MKKTAIVYMCAGISKRFGKIKQFVKIGPDNETLIEYSLKQALPAGFSKVIFIVGNSTEKPFKNFFGNSYKGIPIYYALQKFDPAGRDKPWGTADAVCAIKNITGSPFVLCNGDDLYGKENFKILYEHLQKSRECATIGFKLEESLLEKGKVNRGIFEFDENKNVKEITERLGIEKSNLDKEGLNNKLCSMNLFALFPKDLFKMCIEVENFKKKHKDEREIECFLPDIISKLIKENKIKLKLYLNIDRWVGLTYPEDEKIVKEYLKKNPS